MQNRTKTVASPVFAALLATLALIDLTGGSVRAADECLAQPNQQTPAGGHWYYRVDRSRHRKCWYIGGEGQRVGGNPARSSPSAEPSQDEAAASTPEAISPSNANARAELPKELPKERASTPAPGGSIAMARPNLEPAVELTAAEPSAPIAAPAQSRDQSPSIGFSSDAPWLAGSGAPQERPVTVADAQTATAPSAQQQQPQQLATPSADDDAVSPWRLAAALLLISLGCVVIIGCFVVRLASAGPVGRYGGLSRR